MVIIALTILDVNLKFSFYVLLIWYHNVSFKTFRKRDTFKHGIGRIKKKSFLSDMVSKKK